MFLWIHFDIEVTTWICSLAIYTILTVKRWVMIMNKLSLKAQDTFEHCKKHKSI